MLRIVDSLPEHCPLCSSDNLGGKAAFGVYQTNALICHSCSTFIAVRDREEEEYDNSIVTASLFTCPHCCEIGEIQEAGGHEWCDNCGLDPNEEAESHELAPLWKEGSWIQHALSIERTPVRPEGPIGQFIRNYCGPHCALAASCDQSLKQLGICYHEYKDDGDFTESDEMGKKRRKHRKHKAKGSKSHKQGRKGADNPFKDQPRRAAFQCASDGWLGKRLYANSESIEQSGDSGRG